MSNNFISNDTKKQEWMRINCKNVVSDTITCKNLIVTDDFEHPYCSNISIAPDNVILEPNPTYKFCSTGTAQFSTNASELFENNLDGNIKVKKQAKYRIEAYARGTGNLLNSIYSVAVVIDNDLNITPSRHISTAPIIVTNNEMSFAIREEFILTADSLIGLCIKGSSLTPSTYTSLHWNVYVTVC